MKKEILPGDIGVSLARGNANKIISCVIDGITTNAIAKEAIPKYTEIIVVPGGTSNEPYVVPTSIEISNPIANVISGVKSDISTTAKSLSNSSIPIKNSILIKCRSLGTGSYIAIGNKNIQEFHFIAAGEAHAFEFVTDINQLYVTTDAGSTGAIEWIGS